MKLINFFGTKFCAGYDRNIPGYANYKMTGSEALGEYSYHGYSSDKQTNTVTMDTAQINKQTPLPWIQLR